MRPCFAYGSNMDRERMASRCPQARAIGPAVLPGYRFFITANGWASVRPDESSEVWGLLWEISAADEGALDRWEEVDAGLYTKELYAVRPVRSEPVEALVYVETSADEGKPAARYIQSIIAAAERAGLPREYVEELRTWV